MTISLRRQATPVTVGRTAGLRGVSSLEGVRIVRFASPSGMSFGVLDGDGQVAQIEGHPFGTISFTGQRHAAADVRLLSPILPSKVVCVGKNYAEHVKEMDTGDAPERPLLFLKPSTSVIGPGDAIRIPAGSTNVHHEVELAVVIGARGARNLSPEQVPASVFGYTIANDVTERDMQKSDGQWTRAKGFDSFCPLGPWIETDLGGLGKDPADLGITCTVDGEQRQAGRTSQLLFDVPTLVSYISQVMTLLPGDVVLTGTPAGVGPIRPGQRVECAIEGLGSLVNAVSGADVASTAGGAR
jgi:2-keto-4-pentenoate hydratase/2-oxohepta-3-ene-1,7-dioic acid hydratase in catechol pathway